MMAPAERRRGLKAGVPIAQQYSLFEIDRELDGLLDQIVEEIERPDCIAERCIHEFT
jgi:hypothetical protein